MNWHRPTKAAAASLLLLGASTFSASAQMVLVMESDGSLTATQSQNSFARNYNDGVGQGSAAEALTIFDQPDVAAATEEIRVAAIAPRAPLPRADVLSAIEATALRYGGHSGLRRAGLSVSDWLNLFRANIEIESAYRQNAVSSAGAIGLGQLMPATARDLGVDPRDSLQNLDGSARYLAMMLELFGEPRLALADFWFTESARVRDGAAASLLGAKVFQALCSQETQLRARDGPHHTHHSC